MLEEPQDHETILNILLQNPEELNLKEKPSGIRENKMFTLDMREIPISSAEADDNGAYISKGSAKRLFCSSTIVKDPAQCTKMRTAHFMQTSKPLKATRKSISLKVKFTN